MTTSTTFAPYISKYLRERMDAESLPPATARQYRYRLNLFAETFGNRPLDQFGKAAVTRYMASISHLRPTTRRHYLSTVRLLLRWMQNEGHLAHLGGKDPTAHVGTIRVENDPPVTFKRAQVADILAVCPDLRARAIVRLMVGCGARCCEVSRLRVQDYDVETATIRLRGKWDKIREVPVPDETADVIEQYLDDDRGWGSGPFFPNAPGSVDPLSAGTISTYTTRWAKRAGVKSGAYDGRSAHAFRRTAASDVMDKCGDIRKVQQMLGHESVETTAQKYLRRAGVEDLRDAMNGREYTHEEAARLVAEERARRSARRRRNRRNDAA